MTSSPSPACAELVDQLLAGSKRHLARAITLVENRTDAGKGAIQMVSPLLTHWLQPGTKFETGGIGIMKLHFIPEPSKAMFLAAGLSVLAVLYRFRAR